MQLPAKRVGEAELSDQALAFGQLGAGVARALHLRPVGGVERQLSDGCEQFDLGRHVADLAGERQSLAVRVGGGGVVGVRALQVMAQRHQRKHRLVRVRSAGELDGPLQVLTRLDGVADTPEHATEDAVGAARSANLA